MRGNSSARGAWIAASRTVREIVRARSLAGLVVFLAVLGWGSLFVGSLTIGSRLATAVDLGLAASALFAAAVGILLAVEHGSAAVGASSWPLLSAGLSRPGMLAGRWAGVSLAVTAAAAAPPLFLRFLIILLPNAGVGAASSASAGELAAVAEALKDLSAAALLLPLEALLLAAIAGTLAIVLPRPVALALSMGIWAAGHLHPDPLTFLIVYPGWTGTVLRSLSQLLPDLELYNARIVTADPELVAAAILQSALFVVGSLAAGFVAYRRRDL